MDAKRFLEALENSKDYKPPPLDLSRYITQSKGASLVYWDIPNDVYNE